MKHFLIIFILTAALAFTTTPAFAISAEEARIQTLQQQIQELEKQAAQYRQGIASERAKADTLAKEIAILRGQIGQVEAQIAATDKKIDLTQTEIGQVESHIAEKQTEVQQKQSTIGRMILFMEQQEQQSTLATLVKYANLSMFFRQLDDVATVQDRLLENIAQLRQARMVLEQEQDSLEKKQQELETLNAQAEQKRQQLAGVKGQRDKTLQVTKGVEANYQKQLTNVEKQKAAFFKELRELELKVVSGGLYIVHITADSVPPPGTKLFAWPEDHPVQTQGYGMTTYAKRGAYGGSPHNGLDMSSGYGSEIKAIGDGQIVANGSNTGWGNWVAIKHLNNMVSIYGHMSSLSFLKVGSQVSQGQVIGYEGSTGNATGSHLHLSLYREFFTYLKAGTNELYFNYFEGSLNPANYL